MGSWRSTLFRALRAHYERVQPGGHGGSFLSFVTRTEPAGGGAKLHKSGNLTFQLRDVTSKERR